jgi:cardiolipin synthase
MNESRFVWNIPNILSLYRMIISPVILFLVWNGNKDLFTLMLSISLITDILDGLIARTFKMATPLGAKLDSIADIFTYTCAAFGLYRFEFFVVTEHAFTLGLFFLLYVMGFIIGFIRFGRVVGLHIYAFKITGYLQGIFIFILFVFGFFGWFYYIVIWFGIWANIEDIIILLLLKKPRSDVKGLYWVIKDNKA